MLYKGSYNCVTPSSILDKFGWRGRKDDCVNDNSNNSSGGDDESVRRKYTGTTYDFNTINDDGSNDFDDWAANPTPGDW